MKIAVIKTGGKQYKVQEGDTISIEKVDVEPGKKVVFDEVLFVGDEKDVNIGEPVVKGAKVEGEVMEQKKDKKITIIKHKPKKRYLKKMGHRQSITKVKISKIG